MDKDKSGPAFPGKDPVVSFMAGHEDCAQAVAASFSPGLTKREWFAGMALQGHISSMSHKDVNISKEPDWGMMAKSSIRAADALLKELEKNG